MLTHRIDADITLDLTGCTIVLVTPTRRTPIGTGRAMLLAIQLDNIHARESTIAAIRAWERGVRLVR